MTDLTDEAVKALLDAEPDVWTWRSCENSQGWNTKFGDAPPKPGPYIEDIAPLYAAPVPDLASALLEARAENARLRADAQAAVAELAALRALCQDKGGPGGVQTSTGP